jgi:hypothetical protein
MARLPDRHRAALFLGLCLAAPLAGCKGKGGGPLARAEPADEAFAAVPVPPAEGPKLFALPGGGGVFERPSLSAKKLGELRVGAPVARSKEPYSRSDCDGGWYAVRPRGFVCVGAGASLDPTVAARGAPAAPELEHAMPYRYARARTENVPLYARAPSPAEQLATEPDLKKILGRGEDKDPLGAAADDVPLDPRGVPSGPPVLLPGGEGIEGGKRTVASYFGFGADAVAPSFAPPPADGGVKAGALRKGSGVALAGSLELESTTGLRRFGVTADGQLVPVDRLRPALGSTWHGIDLDKVGLPVAFVHHLGVHTFSLARGKATKHDDEVERRTAVPLTGKFRTVEGVRYEETREGQWMRSQDLMVIVKRHKYPDFAKGVQKWMDVSIASQTLTAYEGQKPIYATLVSTGRDQLKDPEQSASTPRGAFRVIGRHVTRALDPREVSGSFDVTSAPWVLELEGGFSLAGMYWGDGVGEAGSYHDIALAPIDAHRLWAWADAELPLPEGWQAVYEQGGGGHAMAGQPEGSVMVSVRP